MCYFIFTVYRTQYYKQNYCLNCIHYLNKIRNCNFRHKLSKEQVVLAVPDQVNVIDFIQREPIEMKCYQHLFPKYNVQIWQPL